MNIYENQLRSVLNAVNIFSSMKFSWFDHISDVPSKPIQRLMTDDLKRAFLKSQLQSRLYELFYCQGAAVPALEKDASPLFQRRTPFAQRLSRANQSTGFLRSGWVVIDADKGNARVVKDGLHLSIGHDQLYIETKKKLIPGDTVALNFPKEMLGMSPGFYMALSNSEFDPNYAKGLLRLYWNISPDGAVILLEAVTKVLNKAGISFSFKVINNPDNFTRCDCAVLYIYRENFSLVKEYIAQFYVLVKDEMKVTIPALTKKLAPGLGLAEDLGQGESFGWQCCHLIAEGLICSFENKKYTITAKIEYVARFFKDSGLRLEDPFLNHHDKISKDYGLEIPMQDNNKLSQFISKIDDDRASYLETAVSIAEKLSDSAIWYQQRCTWLGYSLESSQVNLRGGSSFKNLGPYVYDGNSGVAYFFAQMAIVTQNERYHQLSIGATLQAFSQLENAEYLKPGLYSGSLGVLSTSVKIGCLLQDQHILDTALQLAILIVNKQQLTNEFDIVSGCAGDILALLSLYAVFGQQIFLDAAIKRGDLLVNSACINGKIRSWRYPNQVFSKNLTGYSHGTSGIAHSLLELFLVTQSAVYRETALAAFTHERMYFNTKLNNWPDFRSTTKNPDEELSCMNAWCHGAPGIALARVRAFEILGDRTCLAEAQIALKTTQYSIEKSLQSENANFSLCHGVAGNADILLTCRTKYFENFKIDKVLLGNVARYGQMKHASQQNWRFDRSGKFSPSLMVGLAGIGYFYLRLFSSDVESILFSCELKKESLIETAVY